MNDVGREIELKLRGNLLRDWCLQCAKSDECMHFEDAWCSGYKTIRFSTDAIERLCGENATANDCWGFGKQVLYEIESLENRLLLQLRVSLKGLASKQANLVKGLADSIAEQTGQQPDWSGDSVVVVSWDLASGSFSANDAVDVLEDVWLTDVAYFERALVEWLTGERRVSWRIPEGERKVVSLADVQGELFVEGAQVTILTDRFERSQAARRRCIAAHGAACAVCGLDFGKIYGEQFAGKIEVHHKVPLSEIREGYEVDPVNDLVPVCSNCHTVIHSKPGGGAYSVEEVRAMLGRAE